MKASQSSGIRSASLSQFGPESESPVDKSSSPDESVATQSRFWVGPLVAGCCFALGYGVTHRVLTLQTNAEEPTPEAFAPLAFPGDSLQEIRARFSEDGASLQVDVTALEAKEAANRPPKPVVKTKKKADLALQTPSPPVWTPPSWSDPQTTAPGLMPEASDAEEQAPPTASEPVEGTTEPGVSPDGADMLPASVVPADDSPVLVAEPNPDPVIVPPGAEAFFETTEPVMPPQP